jgi:hypothetical protein
MVCFSCSVFFLEQNYKPDNLIGPSLSLVLLSFLDLADSEGHSFKFICNPPVLEVQSHPSTSSTNHTWFAFKVIRDLDFDPFGSFFHEILSDLINEVSYYTCILFSVSRGEHIPGHNKGVTEEEGKDGGDEGDDGGSRNHGCLVVWCWEFLNEEEAKI